MSWGLDFYFIYFLNNKEKKWALDTDKTIHGNIG